MLKNNFDFLRFLFAFIVVLAHIVSLSGISDFEFLKKYFDSYVSVTGFFIISGYLITGSLEKTSNYKKYLLKRANRLLPAYVLVIVLCAILFGLLSAYSVREYFANGLVYKYLVANLLFVNFVQPCLPGVFLHNILCTINGALWTIKVEVSFYLVLPIILWLISRFNKNVMVFVLIYLVGIIYKFVLGFGSGIMPAHSGLFEILKHQLPGFLTYFISGIYFYYNKQVLEKNKNALAIVSLLVFGIEYYLNVEIFRPLAMSVLIMYFAYGFKLLNNFGKYGDFSYGIYIFHFPLIQLTVSLGLFTRYNPFLVAFILIGMILLFAFASWNLVEKHFLKRKPA